MANNVEVQQQKFNKDGSLKKIQEKKTENRKDYQRKYMQNYISKLEEKKCDICNGKYKLYSKHKKGKYHTILEEYNKLKIEVKRKNKIFFEKIYNTENNNSSGDSDTSDSSDSSDDEYLDNIDDLDMSSLCSDVSLVNINLDSD
jgi:hypothetical protein